MRPLLLKIEGFGPYLKKTEIDFEKFADSSLFLISGPTGGGKTSILDAMSFALFCEATGGNRKFIDMRNSFADESIKTIVDFTFVLKDKKYKFVRSIKIRKKRGSEELVSDYSHECKVHNNGQWETMESGSETAVRKCAEELLHLDSKQFSQVIVLPQGDFLKFLRASSNEKGKTLDTLFGANIWRKVTEISRKKADELQKQCGELLIKKASLLESFEVSGRDELSAKKSALENQFTTAQKENLIHIKNLELKNKELESASEYMRLFNRLAELKDNHQKFTEELLQSENSLSIANNAKLEIKETQKLLLDISAQKVTLNESLEKLNTLNRTIQQITEFEKRLVEFKSSLKSSQDEISAIDERIANGKKYLDEAEKSADALPALIEKNAELEKIIESFKKLLEYKKEYNEILLAAKLTEKDLKSKKVSLTSLDSSLKAQENLLKANSAYVLASSLNSDEPCPVCGSTSHPQLAHKSENAMSVEDIETLKLAVESAKEDTIKTENILLSRKEDLKKLEESIAKQDDITLKLAGDSSQAEIEKLYQSHTDVLANARKTASLLQKAKEKVNELQNERENQIALVNKSEKDIAALNAEIETLKTQANDVTSSLNGATSEDVSAKLNAIISQEKELSEKVDSLSKTHDEIITKHSEIKAKQSENEVQLKKAESEFNCFESDFTPEELPNLDKIRVDVSHAQELLNESSKEIGSLTSLISSANNTLGAIDQIEKELTKAEENSGNINALSKLFAGENPHKTPIVQYVLSIMLDEIIRSANHFFHELSRGRYALKRITEQQGGNAHRGLDIEVIDGFSMTSRSIETLSGGEQFLASLSLALGLSDVVQNNSGAVRLDSLFIDEGFGSLDEETLSTAIEALESIQKSGRLVGIISHVSELKSRIRSRIEVTRDASGFASAKVKL